MTSIPDYSDIMLYSMDGLSGTFTGIKMVLDDVIDFEKMEKALARTTPRFPYFMLVMVEKDGRRFMEKTEIPFILHRDPPEYMLCEKDNDGFLLRVSAGDNILSVSMFHALTDGRGLTIFANTLLGEYYSLLGEEVTPGRDSYDINSEPSANEYSNPFINMPENIPYAVNHAPSSDFFIIPEKTSGKSYIRFFSVDEKAVMDYLKPYSGSPNALAEIEFARAVESVYPGALKTGIKVSVTINAKNFLGMPESNKPCLATSAFTFDERIMEFDEEKLYTCVRGKLIADTSESKLYPTLNGLGLLCNKINSLPTVEEKHELCKKVAVSPRNTVSISYTGRVDYGSIENHILDVIVLSAGDLPLIELSSVHGRLGFTYSSMYEDDRVFEQFRRCVLAQI